MILKNFLVMLGDSLTEYNRWDDLDPTAEVINLGRSGDLAMGVYYRLNTVVGYKPKVVCLQVGINDLALGREPQTIVTAHQKIWRSLMERVPEVRLVIGALVPTRGTKLVLEGARLANVLVRKTNDLLGQAAQAAQLEFVDLYAALAGPDQELPDEFTDDGVHLTPAAYQVWLRVLKASLAQNRP
ncbi:MAG: GDSL-type esterase/lipase family protein [Deltaproteobacteria bacterium]|jgi:lysophospholipase L1-like esterase|nr:GDSL-type esterase/lipase family protein [Deltaproteobacteria bacterium]